MTSLPPENNNGTVVGYLDKRYIWKRGRTLVDREEAFDEVMRNSKRHPVVAKGGWNVESIGTAAHNTHMKKLGKVL